MYNAHKTRATLLRDERDGFGEWPAVWASRGFICLQHRQ